MSENTPAVQDALLFLQNHTLQDIGAIFLSGDESEGFYVLSLDSIAVNAAGRLLKSVDLFHRETQTTISLGIRYNSD